MLAYLLIHQLALSPIPLCPLFSKNFNTKSAIFIHQPPTLSQKFDSREGLFRCKKGLHVNVGKMNIYLKQPPFALVLGLFTAKCGAFWCKMTYVLPLNATRFGAKCSAFWCKTQGKMVLNAVFFDAKREAKA